MPLLLTGFHAVEERVRAAFGDSVAASQMQIFFSNPGPRVKKIVEEARGAKIRCSQVSKAELDQMVRALPELSRDHRGLVLQDEGARGGSGNSVNFDAWLEEFKAKVAAGKNARDTVLILDSVTDPHNTGAILRSADQFGVSLVIIPERRSQSDISSNEIIARSSAGAASYVPVAVVPNLVRAARLLKECGFWIYGADAGGTEIQDGTFAENSCLIMGSEGSGIARLLREECDTIVSIPTCGRIDSLNVSVAAGVLLYEIYRQSVKN